MESTKNNEPEVI